MNEPPTRQEREYFLHMHLENFMAVQPARPDNEPEIFTRGESFFQNLVDFSPATPIAQSWPVCLRGEFKHELAKGR